MEKESKKIKVTETSWF